MAKVMSEKKFNTLLNERSILNAKIDELKSQVEIRENEIKAYLEDNDLDERISDLYKVTYAETVSMRFNTDLFKKENNSIYEKYRNKEVVSRPFHVYPIKK